MSSIEWTDETWNPVVGCDHVSEGCRNCYAEKMSNRLASMDHSEQYDNVVDEKGRFAGGQINTVPKMLEKPLHWEKPRRVFVNSMSDLFHPDVPFEFIDKVFAVMALADQHTFQILTKRPKRMREYFEQGKYPADRMIERWSSAARENFYDYIKHSDEHLFRPPLPNVWLGVSVEDQETADERIPPLLDCPAEVRFLSCEPLLGPIDLHDSMKGSEYWIQNGFCEPNAVGAVDWVITGGESGPGARPSHPDWFRSLRDQCDKAGVPLFFKQNGAWKPLEGLLSDAPSHRGLKKWGEETASILVGKNKAGRELDGQTHDEFPKTEVTNHEQPA